MAGMSSPDPSRIIDTLCAYWETAVLTAAIDLRLFSALGRGARSASDLAAACAADRGLLVRLCDSLVSLGFMHVRDGKYCAATDAARFLDAASPAAMVASKGFFNGPMLTTAFANLAATVRGGSRGRASRAGRLWPGFARSTLALRSRNAKAIATAIGRRGSTGRILDVGGGASPLGIELLRRSSTATLVVRDRAPVVTVAREHARAARVGDRVATIAGDVLKGNWGGPFDLVLMVNVLDYFEGRAQIRLLREARKALEPGGTLAIVAPLLDPDRRSPADAVAYDLLLLALGSHARPATWQERRQQLLRAGFAAATRRVDPSMVLARTAR
jgi:SAM-dependent methyltransferase